MHNTSGPSLLVKAFSNTFTDGKPKQSTPRAQIVKLPPLGTNLSYQFDLSLQVREDMRGDGSWTKIPFEKGAFKLQIGAQRKFKIKLSKR